MVPCQGWGPRIRLGCSFGRFRRFEKSLTDRLGRRPDDGPRLTFVGSGDFHHVSLALVRRLTTPFNLLVIDNHPDWMRCVPVMHCGTWLWHAYRLPNVRHIYHVGGDVDFDNAYRYLAPWSALKKGRIVVLPAVRSYRSVPGFRAARAAARRRARTAVSRPVAYAPPATPRRPGPLPAVRVARQGRDGHDGRGRELGFRPPRTRRGARRVRRVRAVPRTEGSRGWTWSGTGRRCR